MATEGAGLSEVPLTSFEWQRRAERAERTVTTLQGRLRAIETAAADLRAQGPAMSEALSEAAVALIRKAEQDRDAQKGRAQAKFKAIRLKADPQTDGTLLEESILMLDVPDQGDAIEVATPNGRDWLDVERRVFTPEGEVEVWVTMEGYDREHLVTAMALVGDQFDGSAP